MFTPTGVGHPQSGTDPFLFSLGLNYRNLEIAQRKRRIRPRKFYLRLHVSSTTTVLVSKQISRLTCLGELDQPVPSLPP